jgi:predicted RNA-binding Zn ribbon-like protein
MQRALDVRDGLQALAFVNNGGSVDPEPVERMNRALRAVGLFVQLGPSAGPDFRAERRDFDAALALIGTVAALAQLDGRWPRLKACRGRHCGWAFYDHSRNQAGNWCAMATCGSRTKARQYRQRRSRAPSA